MSSSEIKQRKRQIVEEFSLFDDWMGKYEYLIELGDRLPPLDARYKTDEYKIPGCQSQVWLRPTLESGRLFFFADSDAMITKGLVALLIRVLDGQLPRDVAGAEFDFLDQIGMREHLSSTRRNGLASMVRRIQEYASGYAAAEAQGPSPSRAADGDQRSTSGAGEPRPEAAQDAPTATSTATTPATVGTDAQTEHADTPSTPDLEEEIVEALKTVYDPEIPINVYDLGLIYEIRINPDCTANITMTLTAPNCPAAGFLPGQVESAARSVEGVVDAEVRLTFDPPYNIEMMSEEARLELGLL